MTRIFPFFRHAAIAFATTAMLSLAAPGVSHAEEFSDGQLKSFAMAWTGINQLAEEWKPQVEAAESKDRAAELLEQFEAEANDVIEETDGIGTAEYQSIMKAAQADPALKERIFAMLQEVQQ
jgi:vacuolar-type H+-ATPase subunit H